MDKLKRDNPELYDKVMSDPIHQIFQGLDPRDLEVNPEEYKAYPGTKKGFHPQDDPEFFKEWIVNNMPKAYDLLLKRIDNMIQNNIDQMTEKHPLENEDEDDEEEEHNTTIDTDIYESSYVEAAEAPLFYWQMSTLEFDLQNVMEVRNVNAEAPQTKNGNYSDLPMIPENLPLDWDSQVWFLQHWSEFRDSLK